MTESPSAIDSAKRCDAMDVRLRRPGCSNRRKSFAGRVLVVTKQNRIVLLDPTNGSVPAETTRPTWIVGLEIVTHHGARRTWRSPISTAASCCSTRRRQDGVASARVPSRPTGRPALVTMPVAWQKPRAAPGSDDLLGDIAAGATQRQTVLRTDRCRRFLYRLALPEEK